MLSWRLLTKLPFIYTCTKRFGIMEVWNKISFVLYEKVKSMPSDFIEFVANCGVENKVSHISCSSVLSARHPLTIPYITQGIGTIYFLCSETLKALFLQGSCCQTIRDSKDVKVSFCSPVYVLFGGPHNLPQIPKSFSAISMAAKHVKNTAFSQHVFAAKNDFRCHWDSRKAIENLG